MTQVSRTLPIAIGGIPAVLDLSSLSEARRARVHEYYTPFRSEEIRGAVRVHMTVEPGPPFISLNGFQELQIWTRRNADGTLSFSSFFEEGVIDFASGTGSVVLREEGNPENFLRVLYAWAAESFAMVRISRRTPGDWRSRTDESRCTVVQSPIRKEAVTGGTSAYGLASPLDTNDGPSGDSVMDTPPDDSRSLISKGTGRMGQASSAVNRMDHTRSPIPCHSIGSYIC